MNNVYSAPKSESELIKNAITLKGKTLQQLACQLSVKLPRHIKEQKGFIGWMLEQYLGATAGTLSEADFTEIGVELKSIPVGQSGLPCESTFVCNAPLKFTRFPKWADSNVRKKTTRVLWIPIEALPNQTLATRRIGDPILWSLDSQTEQTLKADWEELIDLIGLGYVEDIDANMGCYLHIKPRSVRTKSFTASTDSDGNNLNTIPRGFYLRPTLTAKILQNTI